LIKNIDKDNSLYIIVKNITSFAKDLGIKIIAEFVHSKEVYETLQTLDIDGYQGYYLAKPEENV
jgi:EAL domain-containing protein (putative c-di-GMP-specific phosphodiesterase class I)